MADDLEQRPKRLTAARRMQLWFALRDLAAAYAALRDEHAPGCRCRAEVAATVTTERERTTARLRRLRSQVEEIAGEVERIEREIERDWYVRGWSLQAVESTATPGVKQIS